MQIVKFPAAGGAAGVRRMELDPQQAGSMDLDLGDDVEWAMLAISALVRGTTEPMVYEYELVPR